MVYYSFLGIIGKVNQKNTYIPYIVLLPVFLNFYYTPIISSIFAVATLITSSIFEDDTPITSFP